MKLISVKKRSKVILSIEIETGFIFKKTRTKDVYKSKEGFFCYCEGGGYVEYHISEFLEAMPFLFDDLFYNHKYYINVGIKKIDKLTVNANQ